MTKHSFVMMCLFPYLNTHILTKKKKDSANISIEVLFLFTRTGKYHIVFFDVYAQTAYFMPTESFVHIPFFVFCSFVPLWCIIHTALNEHSVGIHSQRKMIRGNNEGGINTNVLSHFFVLLLYKRYWWWITLSNLEWKPYKKNG